MQYTKSMCEVINMQWLCCVLFANTLGMSSSNDPTDIRPQTLVWDFFL